MRWLLIIVSIFLLHSAKGQQKNLDCILLQKAIETDVFQKRFYICENTEDVYIIDTGKYFGSCNLKIVCERKLSVRYNCIGIDSKNIIEVYRVGTKKNIFTLYFHRPLTGAALILKLKKRK